MYHSGGHDHQYSGDQRLPPGNRGGPPPLPPRSASPLPPLPPRPQQFQASSLQPNFRQAANPLENLSSSFANLTTASSPGTHSYHSGEQRSYVSPSVVSPPSTHPYFQEHIQVSGATQSQERRSPYPAPPTRPLQPAHQSFQGSQPSPMAYFPPPPPAPYVEEVKYPESPIPIWQQIPGRPSQSIPQQPSSEPPPSVVIKIKDLARPARGSQEVIHECPYPENMSCHVRWYFPKATPNFFVCSYCFDKHIRGTVFDIQFDSLMSPVNEKMWCNFGAPRAQKLWSKTVELNDFGPLKAYMRHRASIQNCHGIEGVKGTAKVRWFTPKGGEIEGFVSCESCYENVVLASSFSDRFKPYEVAQPADATFACDITIKYVARAMKEYSKTNDWNGFVRAAAHRMKVPNCGQYAPVPSVSRSWYHPKWYLPKFASCEACYLDYFAITPMESRFEPCPNHLIQKYENRICTMGNLPMRVATGYAIDSNNYRLFYENARIFVENPPCKADGITDGKWYTLKNGFDNFDLCPSCYSCCIETPGFGSYFKETSYTAGTTRSCDFWPTQPKWMKWMQKLSEAIYVNDFTILEEFIVTNANIPPCPKSEPTAGRLWYGTSDFLICQQCYEDAIKGTKLVPRLTWQSPTPADSPQRCAVYSPRMRNIWAQACEQNDFDGFTAVAKHRNDIYMQTVIPIRNILRNQRLALMRQQYLNAQSNFNNFMNGVTSTSINYTGIPQTTYTYGAADVGYGFATQFGVEGARLGNQALAVAQSAMGETAKVGMLEKIWREVE